MHITGIFLVITMATTYPGKKMKRTVLPTVRITESLHHRVLQYVHLTVTKIKRIREKLNLKIISIFLKKLPLWYLECTFLYRRKLIGIVVNIG